MKNNTKDTVKTLAALFFWAVLAGFLFVITIDKIMLFTAKFRQ